MVVWLYIAERVAVVKLNEQEKGQEDERCKKGIRGEECRPVLLSPGGKGVYEKVTAACNKSAQTIKRKVSNVRT